VRTGPTYGKIAIFHGGTKLGVFDLYTPSVSHRFIPFFGTSTTPRKSRSFTFYVTGRKNSSASSFAINIDSVIR
jgi:hypothetical protein